MRVFIFLLIPFQLVAQNHISNNSSLNVESVFPDSIWQYNKDPSQQGWDLKKFSQLKMFIADSSKTTGMVVIQHGKVIFEYGDIKELSYIASCRKSVLAMLYGPFVENRKIDLDKTLEQLNIDDVGGLMPIEKKATIRNLLTSRSGVYHPASYPGDDLAIAPTRGSVLPGSLYLYSNWDFNLAGHIFETLAGTNIYDAIDSMLAKPLNMQDWKRDIQQKQGNSAISKYPAYPMWFSTRDMARIGYLMLRNGKWKSQQVISAKWAKLITTPFTTVKEISTYKQINSRAKGYGYLWWTNDPGNNNPVYEGAYSARGAVGQFIEIIPKLDMVVAHKTKNDYGRATPENIYLKILDKLIASNQQYSVKNETKHILVNTEILRKYLGNYQHPDHPARWFTVYFENDTLKFTRSWDNYKTAIIPLSDSVFVSADGLYTSLRFVNMEKGNANTLITTAGNTVTANRISSLDKSTINYNELTGDYFSKELQSSYTLEIKDKKLRLISKGSNYSSELIPVTKDVFMSRGQQLQFYRSEKINNIRGFYLRTQGLKELNFIKK